MKWVWYFFLLGAVTIASACSPGSIRTRTPVIPTLPSTPSLAPPLPSPTTNPNFSIQNLTTLSSEETGNLEVIGTIENLSTNTFTEVLIEISLFNPNHEIVEMVTSPLLLEHLPSKEQAPFLVQMAYRGEVGEVIANISDYQLSSDRRGGLELIDLSYVEAANDETVFLGEVRNPGIRSVEITGFTILMVDDDGVPLGVALKRAGLQVLGPGEQTPILAVFEGSLDEPQFVPYFDAIMIESSNTPSIEGLASPILTLTGQGKPFVLGEIQNTGEQSARAAGLIILRFESELIGLGAFESKVPLNRNEIRSYMVDQFPGLPARMSERDILFEDLTVELLLDPATSVDKQVEIVELDLQITYFEPIGSSLIVRGIIRNPRHAAVAFPSIFGALRSTSGEIVTATWFQVADGLGPSEGSDFLMTLNLPSDADLTSIEFDFLALGVPPPETSPPVSP